MPDGTERREGGREKQREKEHVWRERERKIDTFHDDLWWNPIVIAVPRPIDGVSTIKRKFRALPRRRRRAKRKCPRYTFRVRGITTHKMEDLRAARWRKGAEGRRRFRRGKHARAGEEASERGEGVGRLG